MLSFFTQEISMNCSLRNRWSASSPRRVERYRPGLHPLEERLLLSVCTVSDLGDNGNGSDLSGDLRYCLSQVQSGDTVTFSVTGTIDLTRPLPTLSIPLTITGPGADSLTVERNSTAAFRIFTLDPGADVDMSGLSITNGTENQGAAILNNSTLTLTDMVFHDNLATNAGSTGAKGGAIFNNGRLTVVDSRFENNSARNTSGSASDTGGAIYNASGKTADISGSTFTGNVIHGGGSSSEGGAGIYNAGTLTISSGIFNDNTSTGSGGAILNTGPLTVNTCTFSTNHANGSGGGHLQHRPNAGYGHRQFLFRQHCRAKWRGHSKRCHHQQQRRDGERQHLLRQHGGVGRRFLE
jgi:hypothetical protein